MKRPWRARGTEPLPDGARALVGTDRVLAWSREEATGRILVVGEQALYAVPAPAAGAPSAGDAEGAAAPVEDGWVRAWHLVDAGSWDRETSSLRVSWVDGHSPQSWRLPLDSLVPELFRARVQATVVLAEQVDLGPARRAKVVVRKDLRDQSLFTQVVLARGSEAADPDLRQAITVALARLKEQVGLT